MTAVTVQKFLTDFSRSLVSYRLGVLRDLKVELSIMRFALSPEDNRAPSRKAIGFCLMKSFQIHSCDDFPITELTHGAWRNALPVNTDKYWSGELAPVGRHFETRLLWSETGMYVRFDANQTEPLVVSDNPNLSIKTNGLWDRDVCEIFVAPDRNDPRRYFEFEIAPTGEWIDLAIHQMPDRRETDWDYASGMESQAEIQTEKVVTSIKIPWDAFGRKPQIGDVWMGNLYRCVGEGETRGYLAWSPTMTPEPAFHVPEKFCEFVFA